MQEASCVAAAVVAHEAVLEVSPCLSPKSTSAVGIMLLALAVSESLMLPATISLVKQLYYMNCTSMQSQQVSSSAYEDVYELWGRCE